MALDRKLFDQHWAIWCSLLAGGQNKSQDDSRAFYAIVQHLTDDLFREASKAVLKSETYFPAPAKVLEMVPNRISAGSTDERKLLTDCTDAELADQSEFLRAEILKCEAQLATNEYMKYAINRMTDGLKAIEQEEKRRGGQK